MIDDLPIEISLYILDNWFEYNPTFIQLSRLRCINNLFKLRINEYITNIMRMNVNLRKFGIGAHAASTIQYANPCWISYQYIAGKKCCICEKKFNGQVRSIGAFAHDECIKTKCISTVYVCRPFSEQGIARMNQHKGLLAGLEMRASLTESTINIPKITWNGWSKHHGEYTYDQVFVSDIPMIRRDQTLLGSLYETDEELKQVIKYETRWQHEFQRKEREEIEKEKQKVEEMKRRKLDALSQRKSCLKEWLVKNKINVDIKAYYNYEPIRQYLQPNISAPSFTKVTAAILLLPRVEQMLQDIGGNITHLNRLPTDEMSFKQTRCYIENTLKMQREAEERKRIENERRQIEHEKWSKRNFQFKNRTNIINTFLQSSETQFIFEPMNSYERRKVHEACSKKNIITRSEGDDYDESRYVVMFKE